jgi:hypothetical protein
VAECGGLLILPDPFAPTDLRLFCLRWALRSCSEIPSLAFKAQQKFSKTLLVLVIPAASDIASLVERRACRRDVDFLSTPGKGL